MKKKSRSHASMAASKSNVQMPEEVYIPPLDVLYVKVLSLQLTEDVSKHYAVKVTFFDQLLLSGIIKSTGARQPVLNAFLAKGSMNYDPSDYEKMCLMADCPLIVHIQPLKNIETNLTGFQIFSPSGSSKSFSSDKSGTEISCCNVDVLRLFIDTETMKIEKRMEPMIKPPLLHRHSWDNLPLLTMEFTVLRDTRNAHHHQILKEANYMKLTLVAAYNMRMPNDEEFIFTAASKIPQHNEMNTGLITFNHGQRGSNRFNGLSFYPKWESLRIGDDVFTKGDEKFVCPQESIQNEDNLDLKYYMSNYEREYMIVWGSFHRSLLLPSSEAWLSKQFRRFSWPFEVHIYGDQGGGHSFMAFLNLFRLLYPGEHTLRLAVPLQWVNGKTMVDKCNCRISSDQFQH